ncbi:MAG: hypothetical protein DME93_05545 [Verrucomicrobia bacterium]|nr:MAG: hypothetical protein DME93_05545 [Verrucomicrobiota bacterium]
MNRAAADTDGAIVMYFSLHPLKGPSVANNETVPSQATLSMFSEQYSLTSKRSGAAATLVGKGIGGTRVKTVGWAGGNWA